MDMATRPTWFAIAIVFIAVVAMKILRAKHSVNPLSLPPLVNGIALLHSLFTKGWGLPLVHDLYTKFGSVFTINLYGPKVTLLIGPEVSAHFFQGLESEISVGNLYDFTIPIFGQEVFHAVDTTTHNEQTNFIVDALKSSKLRSLVDPMFQEVEDYFAKWGQVGIVDLKHELQQVLMLTSSRCLLGNEVREMMLSEVYSLFRELENSTNIISFLFPYIPTLTNLRRDKAHLKLKEIFSATIRSRRCSGEAQEDALQRLIDSKYKDGRSTTIPEISGMIFALIFAGNQTSSTTSIWTGACLLSNEKFLMAAVEEQKHIITKYKDQIGYDALLEMDTLHRCIKEALRMHSAAPLIVRKAHRKFKVRTKEGKEYDIPAGHNLVIPTLLSSKLPYIYKDPHVYDPDRFGPGREEDKVGGNYSFPSFGGGRHVCPGMAFAYMQIKQIWSHLLRNFELKLISPFPKEDWSNAEPKGKVMISYKRRQLL